MNSATGPLLKSASGSLVTRTARALAALSLAARDGEYLGAESDLMQRLGISRPTLRQAAKIAENDRLIAVRRGVNGGFFAVRPTASDVIRSPAFYLRQRGATIKHIHAATRRIAEEAAAWAAGCRDEDLRAELAAVRAGIETRDAANETPADTIVAETRFARLLARMSGNPAIELFLEIGYTFGLLDSDVRLYEDAADRARSRSLQGDLCDAILSGDAEVAQLMMRRRSEVYGDWIERAETRARQKSD